jgi:hypothetical protein
MNTIDRKVEAAKLLKDWSVWMVTVQSGLIGFLANAVSKKSGIGLDPAGVRLTVFFFSMSILFAAWVLGNLPSVVQRLDVDESRHISDMRGFVFPFKLFPGLGFLAALVGVPMWFYGLWQHSFFFAGVLSLLAAFSDSPPWFAGGCFFCWVVIGSLTLVLSSAILVAILLPPQKPPQEPLEEEKLPGNQGQPTVGGEGAVVE